MKKFLSVMNAAVLLAGSLSVGAFAADTMKDNVPASDSRAVYAKYVAGEDVDGYKVVVGWGEMKFTYTMSDRTWNDETHTWSNPTGTWAAVDNSNEITITNHSSKDVTATFGFGGNVSGIDGTFSGKKVNNKSVTVTNAQNGSAQSETVTFMPSGELTKSTDNAIGFVSVGEITVNLN